MPETMLLSPMKLSHRPRLSFHAFILLPININLTHKEYSSTQSSFQFITRSITCPVISLGRLSLFYPSVITKNTMMRQYQLIAQTLPLSDIMATTKPPLSC